MTTLERECASRATNDRGSEIDALRRTVEALTAALAERDQRIERLTADLRMADESQAVYWSELSEARKRIAALEGLLRDLARLSIQSDRYQQDADFRDAVDAAFAALQPAQRKERCKACGGLGMTEVGDGEATPASCVVCGKLGEGA